MNYVHQSLVRLATPIEYTLLRIERANGMERLAMTRATVLCVVRLDLCPSLFPNSLPRSCLHMIAHLDGVKSMICGVRAIQ